MIMKWNVRRSQNSWRVAGFKSTIRCTRKQTRKPSWPKRKCATAVRLHVWRPQQRNLQQINMMCDFLLTVDSNRGHITYRWWDIFMCTVYRLKIAIFAYCILIVNPYQRNSRQYQLNLTSACVQYLVSPNFAILRFLHCTYKSIIVVYVQNLVAL